MEDGGQIGLTIIDLELVVIDRIVFYMPHLHQRDHTVLDFLCTMGTLGADKYVASKE